MVVYTLPSLLLASFASSVAASQPLSIPTASGIPDLTGLGNDIPSDCQTPCDSLNSTFSTCGPTVACLCTDTVANSFALCVDCWAAIDPIDFDALGGGQSVLDAYTNTCKLADISVASLTFTASSVASTATSASSGSQTTANSAVGRSSRILVAAFAFGVSLVAFGL